MENSLYKELSYRVKGFRALSIIVAAVTVILCCIVGIGCWVLIAGVQENEKLLNNAQGIVEKIELTVVEGVQKEPLRQLDASKNKAGRVVQHIAEIDFDEGSPVSTDKDDVITIAQMQNSALHPAPTPVEESKEDEHAVDPNTYKTSFSQRYEVRPNQQMVPPRPDLGVAMATYEIPEEIVVQEIDFKVPQISPNEFSRRVGVDHYGPSQQAVEVPQVFPRQQARPEGHKLAFVDSLMSFTNDLVEDIKTKMNGTIPAVREAFDKLDVLDLFAPIFNLKEPVTHRSERSIGSLLSGGSQILAMGSYAALANFLRKEVVGITEFNLQSRDRTSRKLPGDSHTQVLDALFWAPTAKPTTTTEELAEQILTNQAYADGWEPQVNKVSLEFIGEILNTLLKMMREFLMKDHVMECLWFMFCQDLNHQAKYTDAYGYMARINSVGLKVLTVREERDGEMDTIGEIWKALTAWDTMQCDSMFPKCDGTKALEIVNEVALGD